MTSEEPQQRQEQERPQLTLGNVLADIYYGLSSLITHPDVRRVIIPIIVSLSSVVVKLIIANVNYTEIDFSTYMQQIRLVNEGEIVYEEIYGDTGPLVYPAGHVQIYQWINWLTDDGKDIATAQSIFGYLFVFTLSIVCAIYELCGDVPPWPMYLLVLSKRLFSIYVLRLFNDCWTTACMVGVILLLQSASMAHNFSKTICFLLTVIASDLFSLAISIKMNALLYLPAFLLVSYFLVDENLIKFVVVVAVIPLIQVATGWKFLVPLFNTEEASYIRWSYINQAFNFKRQFLYEWTVNWRFVPEEIFTSAVFSRVLLVLHIALLLWFTFTRFLNSRIIGKSIGQLIKDAFKPVSTVSPTNKLISSTTGPQLIMVIMSITNLIGVVCSRSLHYQFLSWYCWKLPFVLYISGIPWYISMPMWAAHEYAWNVFPSSVASSAILVTILSTVLVGSWLNYNSWFIKETNTTKKNV
ncbi:Dolichyl-phosphate-mannose-glycolipid alpha-mannosyltransferase [Spathaspora passalidarum NRRL Y-27907]|uniref:Dol-P-Man:Man(5)GlcNAc(2)-PP-Dol alpha-1,3-mannosyltransferase n=1 Tax=Spathaspora passalidarum (strain NRRL Y-27907 / 11-Y1) TaxID=619300 RepID=G3AUB5_SPAPN|nr:Dolichyl-phosphate-mannose-glycolipid alpha-mannosyltransferase [Spathaspora passalidarum NRRL Y-27907]EGW30491.1 Dolichyl-phosphate-mannose-glycolipid alpha-mannosyltransferase [Spathaspora passalidarum NRRL Y-27907]